MKPLLLLCLIGLIVTGCHRNPEAPKETEGAIAKPIWAPLVRPHQPVLDDAFVSQPNFYNRQTGLVTMTPSLEEFKEICEALHRKGSADARVDFQNKNFRIQTWGAEAVNDGPYHKYLREKYGVKNWVIALCFPETYDGPYASGYNTTMEDLLKKHFKRDIFAEAAAAGQDGRTQISPL